MVQKYKYWKADMALGCFGSIELVLLCMQGRDSVHMFYANCTAGPAGCNIVMKRIKHWPTNGTRGQTLFYVVSTPDLWPERCLLHRPSGSVRKLGPSGFVYVIQWQLANLFRQSDWSWQKEPHHQSCTSWAFVWTKSKYFLSFRPSFVPKLTLFPTNATRRAHLWLNMFPTVRLICFK